MTSAPSASTPAWLLTSDSATGPCGCAGRRRRGSFLEKTLTDGTDLLRQAMYAEPSAEQPWRPRPGFVGGLDPRVKLLSVLVLLVAVAAVHTPATLVLAYLGILALAGWAGVPVRSFVRRVWLFVPLFTAVAVLPAIFSFVTPGEIVVPLWTWHGEPQGLTHQGLTSAALVVLRAACSVSLVLLVTATTSWTRLLAALGALGVPRIFVTIISMAYRYVFVLLGSIEDMFLARRARTIGRVVHDAQARRFVGATAATTIGKANHLAEEVHQAMTARGYRGAHYPLDTFRITGIDLAAVAVSLAVALALYGGDHLLR